MFASADLTLSYFQKNGFSTPLLVKEKSGLGLRYAFLRDFTEDEACHICHA